MILRLKSGKTVCLDDLCWQNREKNYEQIVNFAKKYNDVLEKYNQELGYLNLRCAYCHYRCGGGHYDNGDKPLRYIRVSE